MLDLYAQGYSADQIGKKFGVSRQRVWSLIKDDPNYRPRPRGGRRIPISEADIREVREMLLGEGLTATEAADELDISTNRVRAIIHKGMTIEERREYRRKVTGTRSTNGKDLFTDEDFISALLKAASETNGNLSTGKYREWRSEQDDPGQYPSEALFGQRKKWNEWKQEAGLPINERKDWIGIPKYTDNELMAALDRWVRASGHDFISVNEAEAARKEYDPSISIYRIRYGSWMDTEAAYFKWKEHYWGE